MAAVGGVAVGFFIAGCGAKTELWEPPQPEDEIFDVPDVPDAETHDDRGVRDDVPATDDGEPEDEASATDDGGLAIDLTIPVAASEDDALQDPDLWVLSEWHWISLYSAGHRGGLRFLLDGVPPRAELLDAAVEVHADSLAEDDPSADIYREVRRDPPPFAASRGDISFRTFTAASVTWVASSVGATWVRSPSLVALLQPVLDDPGYVDGDAVVLVFVPRPDVGPGHVFEFRQWDYGPEYAARLVLRFRVP